MTSVGVARVDTAVRARVRTYPAGVAGKRHASTCSALASMLIEMRTEGGRRTIDPNAYRRAMRAYLVAEIGGRPAERGTCFITTWLFERWQRRNPDWRVVSDADLSVAGEPMIEVPSVRIAGSEAGPVWFTRRPDRNFHEYMSSMMDRRVEGALGGSLFAYFRITVDYPHARALFEPALPS